MREASSRGFWISSHAPYGYNRVMVQDGPKKRPTLEIDPDVAPIVKRMYDMAEAGNGTLEIIRTLNNEGIASPRGKLWARTSVHNILTNEAYTGTLVWGINAKDNADPVRVEKAFPAIITRAQLQRVGKHLSSRAPKFSHPRRVGSSYLLSGLAKCKTCNTPLIGRFAQSGKYSYYVCQSTIKLGRDACNTPTLNAHRFEELVVAKIRSNILTEGNIRDLVKVVAEEMDGVTREQRKRLETIEDELEEVKRKLGRIWHFIETSDAVMTDASDRIREHRERQERLEYFAEQARAVLAQRRKVLDDVNTIAAYAKDMKDFLKESELTERRAFIQSFIKEIVVVPGDALLRYTVPMPDDSSIPGRAAEKVALNGSVLSTLPDGGLGFAIYQIMRTRAVATAARDAAQEVREALARNFTIVDLTRAGEQIQGLKEYHPTQQWQRALDRYPDVRRLLVDIGETHQNLTDRHRETIQGARRQIQVMERTAETALRNNSAPNMRSFNATLSEVQSALAEIVIRLQHST